MKNANSPADSHANSFCKPFMNSTPAGLESQKPASISIWENPASPNFELAGSKTARLFKSKPRRRPSRILAPSTHVAAG
jgi:hypothetical protein